MNIPKLKQYRHYKGGIYTVVGTVTHTETEEILTLYFDDKGNLWVRPRDMFYDTLIYNGEVVNRFTLIKEVE